MNRSPKFNPKTETACRWRFPHYRGISVRSPLGEYLGMILDFTINDRDEVAYALLECRNSDTQDTKCVGFAWDEFSFCVEDDGVCLLLCLDRATLDVLPGLDRNDLPAWNGRPVTRMHSEDEDTTVVAGAAGVGA